MLLVMEGFNDEWTSMDIVGTERPPRLRSIERDIGCCEGNGGLLSGGGDNEARIGRIWSNFGRSCSYLLSVS